MQTSTIETMVSGETSTCVSKYTQFLTVIASYSNSVYRTTSTPAQTIAFANLVSGSNPQATTYMTKVLASSVLPVAMCCATLADHPTPPNDSQSQLPTNLHCYEHPDSGVVPQDDPRPS